MGTTESNFQFDLQQFAGDDIDLDEELGDDEDIDQALADDPDLSLDPDFGEDDNLSEDELAKKRAAKNTPPAAPAIDEETRQLLADIKAGKFSAPAQPILQSPQPTQPQITMDMIAEEFSNDLLSDPKKAAAKLLTTMMTMNQQTEERVRAESAKQFNPIAQTAADNAIDRSMSKFEKHPAMTDAVRDQFATLVNTAKKNFGPDIARMSSSQIDAGLESAFAEAIGRAAMSGKKQNRSAPAPRLSPRGGGYSRTTSKTSPSLSDEERDVIANMRAAKIDDKSIKEAIKELRAEAG